MDSFQNGVRTGLWRPILAWSMGIVIVLALVVVGGRWAHHRWTYYHKIPAVLSDYHLYAGVYDPADGIEALGGREQAATLLRSYIRKFAPDDSNSAAAYFLLSACAADAVPDLISMLASHDARQRICAIDALWFIGPPMGECAVPALVRVLADREENKGMCGAVAATLGRMGPASAPAVPRLCELLEDQREGVRYRASKALGQIGPAARDAVPHLIKLLEDTDVDVRETAIETLGNIGPDAKEAIPILRKMRVEGGQQASFLAGLALQRIVPTVPAQSKVPGSDAEAAPKKIDDEPKDKP